MPQKRERGNSVKSLAQDKFLHSGAAGGMGGGQKMGSMPRRPSAAQTRTSNQIGRMGSSSGIGGGMSGLGGLAALSGMGGKPGNKGGMNGL